MYGEKRRRNVLAVCRSRSPVIQCCQISNMLGQQTGKRGVQPPLPVGSLGAGGVDAGLRAQMQPVGHGDDGHIRNTGKAGADHGLCQILGQAAQVTAGIVDILGAGRLPPAFGGHIVA